MSSPWLTKLEVVLHLKLTSESALHRLIKNPEKRFPRPSKLGTWNVKELDAWVSGSETLLAEELPMRQTSEKRDAAYYAARLK
jgi:predicted DNA-binding transcriptional regulator AlpA